jgi:predicted ATPase/signal transduction histidine kinase
VTFYELLTGQLPFQSQDPLELVHSHIARQPTPPQALTPAIPRPVAEIVLKLMAKSAEARYQSAYGLKADLAECLRQWQATEQIAPFALGQHDTSDRLQIPQKLYGRAVETAALLSAFERVRQGASELFCVAGAAGIGKSALVQEVYKPLTRDRGYFIAGKFDQYQRNVPYSALLQAFRGLARQLLSESEAEIAEWRERLQRALGAIGQIIVNVIPDVALIVGPQPDVAALPPAEAQIRFKLAFQNFIRVFTRPNHPLVLFLDDLQWADGASLKLLEVLMTDADRPHLFVIGAYRENEVEAGSPLLLTLAAIQDAGAKAQTVALGPLALSDVTALVAETVFCAPEAAQPLAELVLAKTGGNPFFIGEFLKMLHAAGWLTFEAGAWRWELDQIRAQRITDNVVALMAGKVQQLSPETQAILRLAAGMGHQFDLQNLALVSEQTPAATAAALWPALVEGLLLPLDDAYKLVALEAAMLTAMPTVEYKFAHDRIQQAVYSLIPAAERAQMHQRIGRLWLARAPEAEREQKLFDIVNQLNQGRVLLATQTERDQLADLNLAAGRRAKQAGAYAPSFNYLMIGIELVGADGWQRGYPLTLALYSEGAEAAYLSADFAQMETWAKAVLQNAQTLLDKVKVIEAQIQARMAQNQLKEAVSAGVQALRLFGITLPQKPSPLHILQALASLRLFTGRRAVSSLIDQPWLTDPLKLAAIRVVATVIPPSYFVAPELFLLLVFKVVEYSLRYGHTQVSPFGYGTFSFVLAGVVGDIPSGYQFARLAIDLVDRLDAKAMKSRTFAAAHGLGRIWQDPIREVLGPLREAHQSGLENGDLEFAGISAVVYSSLALNVGLPLDALSAELRHYRQTTQRFRHQTSFNMLSIWLQAALNLRGEAGHPAQLIGAAYDAAHMRPIHEAAKDGTTLFHMWLAKTLVAYRFRDYAAAHACAQQAAAYAVSAGGSHVVVLRNFYDSLARLALYPAAAPAEQRRLLKGVAANQAKLRNWAKHAPDNNLQKYHLVEAERARAQGRDDVAREHYRQAIDLARRYNVVCDEALACERAGEFYLAKQEQSFAAVRLREARLAYLRWGATAKVADLEQRYPQFLSQAARRTESGAAPTARFATMTVSTSGSRMTETLDLASVLRASQAIAGEIQLGRLLETLLKLLIENAGAQRGCLLLENNGQLLIEAEGYAEAETGAKPPFQVMHSAPPEGRMPQSVLNYVARTRQSVVLADASADNQFNQDPYIASHQCKAIVCAALLSQGKLIGVLFLENNLATDVFTVERLEMLNLLSAQAVTSLENARLYNSLEQKVQERTQALTQALNDLRAAQKQLVEAEKMAALGGMVAGVAHEINTPVGVGVTAASHLAEKTREFQQLFVENRMKRSDLERYLTLARESSELVLSNLHRAAELTQSFKQVAVDQTSEEKREFALKEYLNEIVLNLTPRLKRTPHTIAITCPDAVILSSYPGALSQIITNFVMNSLLHAFPPDQPGQMTISAAQHGEQVVLTYRDDGRGIAPEIVGRIFDPFFTTKRGQGGSGLGLNIVYNLVTQRLNGKIAVESQLDQGAQFTLTFPRNA